MADVDLDLDLIEARAKSGRSGAWQYVATKDAPRLIAEVRRLRAQVVRLRGEASSR